MEKVKSSINIKKELERVKKKMDEIENDPKVLKESEDFQREVGFISGERLHKQFNI